MEGHGAKELLMGTCRFHGKVMNRIYKVIFNRSLGLYQVVSEIARNHGKSSSPAGRGRKSLLVPFVLSALLGLTGSVLAEGTGTADTQTNSATVANETVLAGGGAVTVKSDTTSGTNTVTISVSKDGKVESENTDLVTGGTVNTAINTAVNAEQTARSSADTALSKRIGTLNANGSYIQKDVSVSSNLSTLDKQVKANADAISNEQKVREAKDTELSTKITSNTTDITGLKDLSNVSEAGKTVIKKQAKQAVKVAADGNATVTTAGSEDDGNTLTYTIHISSNGTVSLDNTGLISGGTLYSELRPEDGTYVKRDNTTAANLSALDNNLANVINAMGLDINDTKTSYTSKLNKYFKVNPEVTTSVDGKTKTYAPDAAANGTNSVAIGPSAQAGDKSTDATTSTTTITGGKSSTAIGDSAKANGDQSVALGYGSQVLNTTDQSGKTTATISGSTAIGKGAKVNGAEDAAAVGTSAQVNETATGGIAFGKNAVTGEDKGTVTVGDVTANVAAVGGENSVALGTSAKASGNTALALGKGAQVNNYTTQSGTTVTKTVNSGSTAIGSGAVVTGANDAVAFGSGAKIEGTGTNADDSLAIGKSASVATAKDAMALGTSAAVASGANNAVAIGNMAKANTSNTTAIGYNVNATGAGAIDIGENTATSTEGGISIGSGTSVSGKSIVIGYTTDARGNTVQTESQNYDAVAIGNGAQANANDSISIGHQAGKGTNEGRTSGYGSLIAIGTNAGNNVKGMQNVALGSGAGSNVKSSYNVAIGSNAGAGINYAAATDANPQNGYNVSIGYEANYQSADANAKNIAESIAIGHSANAVSNATALGYTATASGDKSMALGYHATASDADSIALGEQTNAADGNIAIGNGSIAPAVSSLGTVQNGYVYKSTTSTDSSGSTTTLTELKSAFTYKPLSSTSHYVSFGISDATGTSTLSRRLSNVADGVFDSDAATVGQLNSLNELLQATDAKVGLTTDYFDKKFTDLNTSIDAVKPQYFSISSSSDTLLANKNNTGASSTAADAMAIGPNATATSAKAVAIGNNVSASGKGSIALGTADNPATSTTITAGGNTSTNPHVTSAEGANSVAVGTSAIAQTDNSVALGTRASVYTSNVTDTTTGTTTKVGRQSIAIGYEAETRNSDATSIGSGAKAYSNGSTAIGHSAYAQGADSAVIGTSSTANGASAGILGKSNTVNGSNTYAVGSENNVNGNWGAVTYSGLYGSKNTVNPVSDTSGNTKHGMASLSVTGNSNTINQKSYSDTVQNISILGNSNSVTGASDDEANAGTMANITVIGGNNEVTGRDGAGSDDMGKTWNQLTRTTVIGYGNTVNQAKATTSLANTQILGNDVTATLGNSVYLGTGSSAKNANSPDTDTLVKAETDAANAVDTTGMTDDEETTALSDAKAKARYAVKLAAMKANKGSTAGTEVLNTDTTYDDGTSYTYAGSSPVGVVTVGSVGAERRIQNVAAGLVSASSTDAVNGSQLYALTRQLRLGGDNSSFGTTTADDKNVVARGSNETIAITGGSDAVKSSTADGTTTYTVDTAKLTDNNIAVVADTDKNALHVQLASNLKDLNTAQLGSGSGESYKETIKLDGTGTTGGQMTLAGADGTVKTTLDTTGLTIANGPKFTSSGIDAGSQKINHVTAGTDDADAVNVKQLQSARTLLTQGTNTTLADTDADGHHTYTVNVDNLAVKANGTGTTVALANGINFKNGTNTMATVGADGTVTISASHNKLSTVSAATGDKDNVTLTLTDVDGNTVTSTGLKNTYTTVNKNGTNHTVTFARNDGTTETLSLGDLDGASKNELATAAAKATSEVTNGTNVTSVTKTTGNNNQNIYTVNVDDLAVKTTDGEKKSVHLKDGLVFADGTNTTATVGDNGTVKFNVSDNAIKKQAVNAINVTGGSNVTVTPETNADGTLKTFTVAASDLKYSANGTSKTTSLANGISFAAGSNTTAEIDNNGAIKINATHNKLNATGTATKATADSNAVTLTLNDQDGNTTTTALTDTYTTVSKDATNKKVTFKRNDGETQTLELSDLGGITEAQDKYVTGGKVTYEANGNGTAALTGNNGLTASITGLKDTKVSSGAATYVDAHGKATMTGSATLTMNDGSTATISGLKDDYITSAAVGTENNHVTMTRLGGGTVDLDLNPILGKYSLSDYQLVGSGTTEDQPYTVSPDGTVTLNVVDSKNAANKKTIQITGLASQSGVNAGRTTVKSSDNSVTVSDSAANSDTHTYDIKVDYSKIPANLKVQYSGDNGTSGSNTMDKATAFSGTANQIVTTAADGKVSFKLADDISGINSVTTGASKLDTNGLTVTGGPSVLKTGINAGGKAISNVGDAVNETDAATLKQVKNARTKVAAGDNVKEVTSSEATDGSHQMTYTVKVDNLSVKSNDGTAKEVALKTGLNFKNGTNTTATVGDNGEVKYDLNSTLTGLTSVTAGNSTLDNSGLTIKEGTTTKVAITGDNVTMGGNIIHNVGDGVAPTDAVNKGQLEALQNQVSGGWNLVGKNSDGTAVTAKIGAGKTVTYTDSTYTKSVITKDDSTGNATVKVDVTTGKFGSGTGDKAGTVTSTANGVATTQDVANAINSASINVVADNTSGSKKAVKAGNTVHFANDGNLTLVQGDNTSGEATFTYGLNKEISISKVTTSDTTKGSTVQTAEGVTTTDAAGNTYIQNGQGITLTPSDKTKSPVKLTNTGLDNGGNKITGVGKGTDDTDAVNVAQLKEVNDKVGSGWQLADNDGTRVADIGAGKKVSFKTDSQYLTAKTESAGTDAANVTYGLKTKALEVADGKVSSVDTAEDGLATAKNVADTINQTYWTAASGKSGSGSQTDETANDADKQISAGDTVTFNAGNNLSLAQNGASFTYGLQADLTGMNTITFTPRNDAEGHPISLVIGKQKDGVGTDEGYYITGLDNTTWNQSNYVGNRAATEAQLASAIKQVTLASPSGGFKLSDDKNKEVSQVLGQAIGVVGDGNVTTAAETTTTDTNGHIKVSLNKDIDLTKQGSVTVGQSKLTNGQATIGGVTVNGTEKTVTGLSNTTWEAAKATVDASAGGYQGSTKAATESQLAQAISTATTTAAQNEQHIKAGTYEIGQSTTDKDGNDIGKNSVAINVVSGEGANEQVKGQVIIKDVAKASDVGDTAKLADDIKNKNGNATTVVDAVNNLNGKVGDNQYLDVTGKEIQNGDSSTTAIGKLNNRMNDIYSKATQHSTVTRADDNVTIQTSTNADGGTNYQIGLNKEKIDLGKVTIQGNEGSITAKSMTAVTFTAGNTAVSNEGVKIGDKSALTSDTLKVNGKTYVSGDGLNANSQKITNVAAGSEDTDAVNVKQVNDLAARQGEAITENAAHISELGRAVNKLDNRINRVGAGAAALAALHPGSYDPDDKLDVSAGVGNYRGANAAAVGLFFHPNERTILSVAGSMGGGENMVNAGVTLKVGPGHGTPTTVTTRTGQKVDVMDILAKQTEILEKLAGNAKAASAPAGSDIFPDVPQNHWAYAYVDKLYRTGSLAGFSEPGKLKSHMLTRKDFAEILYWAMTNGATTNPDLNSDGSLNRLAAEFGAELKLVMR